MDVSLLVFNSSISSGYTPAISSGTYTTSMVVRWNTVTGNIGKVNYGFGTETLTNTVVESEPGTFHKVTITGLTPDTKYYYSIDTLSGSEEQYFITLPPQGNREKKRIWVISDFGQTSISDNAARLMTVNRWKNFNEGRYHADLVLSLGDHSENDTQEELQQLYFNPLDKVLLNSSLFTLQGNHDNYDGMVSYKETFSLPANGEAGGYPSNNGDYYSFDYANIHVIALSLEIDDIDGPQLTWLRKDLQNIDKDKTDWLIACLHRPFHSGGYHPTDISSTAQKQRDYWLKELEDYGVDLILQGHNAIYERTFLIDNLIGKTTDITDANIIDRGNGRENGDGAYYKGSGLIPHQGEIIIEVAPSGDAVTNNANYSIFSYAFSGTDKEGSVVVDVDSSNRMDVYFLCNKLDTKGNYLWDYFTIIKSDSITSDQIHFSIISNTAVTFDWVGTADQIFFGTDSINLTNSVIAVHPDFLPVSDPWVSDPGPYWEAKLTGLTENTIYFYKIGNNGQVHKFRTPPVSGTAGFRVCSTSDSHESTLECATMFNQIAGLKPELVITTGDHTGAGPDGQQEVTTRLHDAMVWSQSAAWMPAWGNHDWEYTDFDDLRTLKGRFDIPNPQTSVSSPAVSCCGEDWGWFDYGNTRFISWPERWNTSTTWQDWSRDVKPVFNEAQNDPNIKFIITFGHQSAYTSAKGRSPGSGTMQNILNGLHNSYPKYKLDLSGHNHQYERYSLSSGLTYVINSTAGSYFRGWDNPTKPDNCSFRAIHYGILVLDISDYAIKGQFVCSVGTSKNSADYKPLEENVCNFPGTVIDAFTIYGSEGVTSVSKTINQVPEDSNIRSYPNPFQLSTNIKYSLKQTAHIKIEIYDLLGQKLVTLIDEVKEQGDHSFEWIAKDKKGNNLPGGIYIAKICTGKIDWITKLILTQ